MGLHQSKEIIEQTRAGLPTLRGHIDSPIIKFHAAVFYESSRRCREAES